MDNSDYRFTYYDISVRANLGKVRKNKRGNYGYFGFGARYYDPNKNTFDPQSKIYTTFGFRYS